MLHNWNWNWNWNYRGMCGIGDVECRVFITRIHDIEPRGARARVHHGLLQGLNRLTGLPVSFLHLIIDRGLGSVCSDKRIGGHPGRCAESVVTIYSNFMRA